MSKHCKFVGIRSKYLHFDYEPYPILGVGKNKIPIISMDKYIDISKNLELHLECCKGLSMINHYKPAMFPGSVHISEYKKGKINFTEILNNLEKYDKTGIHRKNIEEIEDNSLDPVKSIYKYIYYAMGGNIPWFFTYYLRVQSFSQKTEEPEILWEDEAQKYFPNVIKYIENLPFKEIGRVLFFTTYPNSGVAAHRDSYIRPHKDHNINLFFSGGWRPSFVWDDIKQEKIYLENGATSYFFNNRDYHGVDPESNFRYTLRVDGVFEDWLQEELGLEDGYTWKENFNI